MGAKHVSVDGRLLRGGVRLASSRTGNPLLCIVKGDTITIVALSGLRLVMSWQFRLANKAAHTVVFLIPPAIASLMSADPLQTQVEISQEGDAITLATFDELGRYELKWLSDLFQFPAPPELDRMLTVPPHLAEVNYLSVSDAVHNAVAKLIAMEFRQQIHKAKLAILVNFSHNQLVVDGREIKSGLRAEYYFDPRLIIRALEFAKSDTVEIGITPLDSVGARAFLSVVSVWGGCRVHCALLSIGLETQKLYPLPPGRNR